MKVKGNEDGGLYIIYEDCDFKSKEDMEDWMTKIKANPLVSVRKLSQEELDKINE